VYVDVCRVHKRPNSTIETVSNLFSFFFSSSFFNFLILFFNIYFSRKSRGIFNQSAQNEDRVQRDRWKKIEFVHWLQIDVSANVPSTCRANKPAARFAQRCKAHLKLKGFPRNGATLRRMHGIRNMRKSPCLYTISQCCRGNYKFGHYVAQPELRRYSPECIFDAVLSNPGKLLWCDSFTHFNVFLLCEWLDTWKKALCGYYFRTAFSIGNLIEYSYNNIIEFLIIFSYYSCNNPIAQVEAIF